jgi:beta-aspartyl-peptidase (threonine type)
MQNDSAGDHHMKRKLTGQSRCALAFFVLTLLICSLLTEAKSPSVKAAATTRNSLSTTKAAQRKQKVTSPEMQIRAVLDEQVAAWNERRLEDFMKGYWHSPDLTFFSGGTKLAGWDATLARYRKNYQSEGREMGRLTFSELDITMLGPASAFVRGRFTLVMSDGKTPTGIFTLVFRKFADGWKVIHDHTSSGQ